MKGLFAVLVWELKEKKSVFIAAVVAGLIPLAMPLFSISGVAAGEIRDITAFCVASAFAVAITLLHGATTIGRELKERRMGFLFSRPVSGAAIWWGKILGGLVIAVGGWVIIDIPSTLVGIIAGSSSNIMASGYLVAIIGSVVVFGSFVLLCLSHAMSVVLRSRSWIAFADVLALILLVAVVAVTYSIWSMELANDALIWTNYVILSGLVVALVAAGQCSLMYGRTDIRRSHLMLSLVFWSVLGFVCLGALSFALWLRAATPSDLVTLEEILYSPKGNWVAITGRARYRGDHYPQFLFNTQSQQAVRVRGLMRYWSDVTLADDGARAVWIAPEGVFGGNVGQLMTVDLTHPEAEAVFIPIVLRDPGRVSLRLSSDGQRLAIIERDKVVVHETLSGKTQAVVRLDEDLSCNARFMQSSDRLRLLCSKRPSSREELAEYLAYDFDLQTKKLTLSGFLAKRPPHFWGGVKPNSDWTRFLFSLHDSEGARFSLFDASNGVMLASWSVGKRDASRFLADGRIVVTNSNQSTTMFYVYSKDGQLKRSFSLDRAGRVRLGGETEPGRLVATFSQRESITDHSLVQPLLVDLDKGCVVRELAEGYQPATEYFWNRSGPVEVASAASKLFIGPHGELATLDPLSGQFTEVLSTKSR